VPGALRVPWVVADARERGVVHRRVVEGVQGTAVDHEAPVDARGLHLGGERLQCPLPIPAGGVRRQANL
jgi:hypothetical protein